MKSSESNDLEVCAAASTAKKGWSDETVGFVMSITSALCYTGSLSLMRGMSNYPDVSPDWTLAVKEMVTVSCVAPIILIQALRGKYRFPSLAVFSTLVLAGVFCELIGARPHLWAYAAIGLTLTTPLVQASQLIMSSVIGAVWLKERVTLVKALALVILIVAVFLLSLGSANLEGEIAGSEMRLGFGAVCVVLTALGYSTQLSLMRRVLRKRTPDGAETSTEGGAFAATTMVMITVCGVGAILFSSIFTMQHGCAAWLEPPAQCWRIVLIAGVANMIGFVFQIESLRRLFVLKQTMIANAQTIALALLGIFCFHEPFTQTIGIGIALVAAGVALAGLAKN